MKYTVTAILLFSINLNKADLGLKLKVGDTYSQSYVSKTSITQNINGMEQVINMEIIGGMTFHVEERMSDRYLMSASYSSLAMKMNSPMGEVLFSSEGETEDMFSIIMKNMVGKAFKIEMHKNGSIAGIHELDNIFNNMFEAFPDLPEQQKAQITAQLKQAYGEKAFKGNIEMITAIFPDQDVEVGESWKNSVKLESGMSAFMNNTFTLVETGTDAVLIDGITEISTEDKDAYMDVNGMPTRYNLSGKMKTSYKVDPQTNWIIEGTIEQEMSGDVQIQDNPSLPGGITIPMTMTNNMTVGQ